MQTRGQHGGSYGWHDGHGCKVQCEHGDSTMEAMDDALNSRRLQGGGIEIGLVHVMGAGIIKVLADIGGDVIDWVHLSIANDVPKVKVP